jgi:chemotaxis protein methyltransferase CheR
MALRHEALAGGGAAVMLDQLADNHFVAIAGLVEAHTGIRLPPSKRTMVEGRLRRRVRALGLRDLEDYGEALFAKGLLEREFAHVVDCVTTNKTDFFREPQQFDLLRQRLLQLLAARAARLGATLKFWSAAASIGAEAYTLAMVAAETLGLDGPPFMILGTDISTTVIAAARLAIYPCAMAEPIPEPYRKRYLMFARDSARDEFRIAPELRRFVSFAQLNLMDERYGRDESFDVIFCRNVLIYFAKEAQTAVIERLLDRLRIGGYLMLGHSETMTARDPERLRQIAPSVFEKVR